MELAARKRPKGAPRTASYAVAALLAALPGALYAQSAAAPTREELGIDRSRRDQGVTQNRLFVKGGIERGPCPLADPSFAAMNVTFSKVTFANLSAVDPSVL